MQRLSRGLVAVLVSMLSAVGLVVTTAQPAQADWKDNLQTVGKIIEVVTVTPGDFVMGELVSAFVAGPVGMSKLGLDRYGSQAEVRAGSKLLSRCTAKPQACAVLGAAALLAGGLAYAAVNDWGENEGPSEFVSPDPHGLLTWTPGTGERACLRMTVPDSRTWADGVIEYSATYERQVTGPFGNVGCNPPNTADTKCKNRSTGVETMRTASLATGFSTVGETRNVASQACTSQEDLVSLVMRSDVGADGGFTKPPGQQYIELPTWGAPSSNPGDRNWTRYTCKTPSGATYTVDAVEAAAGSGSQPLPACNSGDTVSLVESGVMHPDGSTEVQTVMNPGAARDAGNELFPNCVTAMCRVAVRTLDGRECTSAIAGCDDWASNPEQFRCFYGSYERPIGSCAPMERAYEPNTSPSTIPATGPNTDGNPATWDSPKPNRNPTTTPSPSPTYVAPPNPFPEGDPGSNPNPTPTTDPTPQPSPSMSSPGPSTPTRADQCSTGYNLGPVDAGLVKVVNDIGKKYNFASNMVGGYRGKASDHTSGTAADFMTMTNKALGQSVAAYAQQNARSLGIRYVIWQQHIWNIEKAGEGWRLQADRGSPTLNHMDHVHVSTYDTGVRCGPDPDDENDPESNAQATRCFPSGWGAFNPFQWVYKPVMCAMKDAFAPDKDLTTTRLNDVRTKLGRSGPGPAWTQLTTILGGLPQEAGCAGPPMEFDLQGQPFSIKLFDACKEPMKGAAANVKLLSTVVVSITGILGIARAVGMGFGFNFSMGRGGGSDE